MPQKERLRVFLGELKKTSGGLTKKDLIKNKRGKIVSKRKSSQSKNHAENNLKTWLRSKGDKFGGEPKGLKAEDKENKAAPKAAPKAVPKAAKKKEAVPKKKAVPKITKLAPMKAGEKKDLSKVSVGNIHVPNAIRDAYERQARYYKKKKGLSREQIIKKLGPVPPGAKF